MLETKDRNRPRVSGITREVLERDQLRAALAEIDPDLRMISNEDMQRSIDHMLSTRPGFGGDEGGIWLFGYGSLLWNPCVPVAEWYKALLYGYHRDFCIRLTHGRGSPEAPGLMLGLIPGGSCYGMAMKLPADNLAYELLLVWRREMITGVYTPRWTTLHCGDRKVPAITFVTNPDNPSYCGQLSDAAVVHMLATGGGLIGTAADYLKSTVSQLNAQNIVDGRLRMLYRQVEAVHTGT